MISRLLPDQISTLWDVIKFAVENSVTPTVGEAPDKMNRILAAMLSGKLDVWTVYDRDKKIFEGVLVTQVVYDNASGTKNMLLYSLYGYKFLSPERWLEGSTAIAKYAKSLGCSNITAYTNVDRLIEIAKTYNAQLFTYVSVPVSSFKNLTD